MKTLFVISILFSIGSAGFFVHTLQTYLGFIEVILSLFITGM